MLLRALGAISNTYRYGERRGYIVGSSLPQEHLTPLRTHQDSLPSVLTQIKSIFDLIMEQAPSAPRYAESATKAMKGRDFYLALACLCVVILLVGLDATSLAVALPVCDSPNGTISITDPLPDHHRSFHGTSTAQPWKPSGPGLHFCSPRLFSSRASLLWLGSSAASRSSCWS